MTYTRVLFKELTDLLVALFPVGTDGLRAIWREGDETAPSPLDRQYRDSPDGTRLICLPMSMPAEGGPLPGVTEILHNAPAQQYTIELYGLERFRGKTETFPLSRRQAVLNWLRSKIEPWCVSVQESTFTQPAGFTLVDARILTQDIDATSPLTSHGWLAAALRISITVQQIRFTP